MEVWCLLKYIEMSLMKKIVIAFCSICKFLYGISIALSSANENINQLNNKCGFYFNDSIIIAEIIPSASFGLSYENDLFKLADSLQGAKQFKAAALVYEKLYYNYSGYNYLIRKSDCQLQDKQYKEALNTLNRVRLNNLNDSIQLKVLLSKSYYAFR